MSANLPFAWSPGKARKWKLALGELLEAHYYDTDLRQPDREFAVALGRLAEAGLTHNDLRWLLAKGFIEQTKKHGGTVRARNRVNRSATVDSFSRRTRVVLTEAGLAFANQVFQAPPGSVPISPSPLMREGRGEGDSPVSTPKYTSTPLPRWDPGTRTLWLGSTLVKQFKVPALNQELVLSAFDEEGWPCSIDDPLPPILTIDPKRRLHDTIIRLNRNQRSALIRFHGNGNGLAIHWAASPVQNGRISTRLTPDRL